MKKVLFTALSFLMILAMLAGCGASAGTSGAASGGDASGKKIVLICDKIGVNPFLTQMQDEFNRLKDEYGFDGSIVECADGTAWEESVRASVMEDNDLIVAVGWQGADPIDAAATEFPDKATYVLVDVEVDNPGVKNVTFREQEGAYLVGMIAGLVNPTNKFGAVYSDDGPGNIKWEWGYMEGVKAVRDDAEFIKNFTNSYTDAGKAKEFALQQYAAGCEYIFAASAVADMGTFEAAKEKGFYTNSQDADLATDDNPNIITAQLKNTGATINKILTEYMDGTLTMDAETYGVKEGAIGAAHITAEGVVARNPVLTDEIVAQVKEAADKIASGELVLTPPDSL